MKSLFRNIAYEWRVLIYPVKMYIRETKLKIMNDKLSQLLELLNSISHPNFSDVELKGNILFFRYLGGRFNVFKKINAGKADVGYLQVYYENPMAKDGKEIIEDFLISVDRFGNAQITNHIQNQGYQVLAQFTQNSQISISPGEMADIFAKQFDAKMIKDNFPVIIGD